MLRALDQAFDRDVARLREEADERSQEGVAAAVDRVRGERTDRGRVCMGDVLFRGCGGTRSSSHNSYGACTASPGEMIEQMEAALRNQRAEIAAPLQREVDLVRSSATRDREDAVARVREECRR